MANPIKAVKAIGRAVGGITGKGSKQVNPIYRNTSGTNNVTIIGNSKNATIEKSKQLVRRGREEGVLKYPADTAKGTKRGLKAANKPVSKNNEKVYALDKRLKKMGGLKPGETTEYTRNQLKNVIKPARPNRVRGGNLRGE